MNLEKSDIPDGYIIKNNGNYLTGNLYWFPHKQPEQAFVFHPQAVDLILFIANKLNWKTKPITVIPASYSVEAGTTITGEEIPVW